MGGYYKMAKVIPIEEEKKEGKLEQELHTYYTKNMNQDKKNIILKFA